MGCAQLIQHAPAYKVDSTIGGWNRHRRRGFPPFPFLPQVQKFKLKENDGHSGQGDDKDSNGDDGSSDDDDDDHGDDKKQGNNNNAPRPNQPRPRPNSPSLPPPQATATTTKMVLLPASTMSSASPATGTTPTIRLTTPTISPATATTTTTLTPAIPAPAPPAPQTSVDRPQSDESVKVSNRLAVVLGVTCGLVFFLFICCILYILYARRRRKQKRRRASGENWRWFDRWKSQNASPSMKAVELPDDELPESAYVTRRDLDVELESLPSWTVVSRSASKLPVQSHGSTPSTPVDQSKSKNSGLKRKFRHRVLSIGGITSISSTTATTSKTDVVIAAPPPVYVQFPNTHTNPTFRTGQHPGYYDPQETRPSSRQKDEDEVLRSAGLRQASLLLSHNNGGKQ